MKTLLTIGLLLSLNLKASTCYQTNNSLTMKCKHNIVKIEGMYAEREVLYALPQSVRPREGYPTVLFFQGSFYPMEFKRSKYDPFGGYNEILIMKELLDNGFAIIAPRAGAGLFWQSNLIGLNYDLSSDKYFINQILMRAQEKHFGSLDLNNLFAFGISSGGYMTDRMAQSHSEYNFKALAIASASYAKCGGPYCPLPNEIKREHPPTLFLHGKFDPVVPIFTMKRYQKLLQKNGIKTKVIIDPKARHQWFKSAPKEITQWFKNHLN